MQRLEHGDTTVALGLAFDACALLGIALFEEDRRDITRRLEEGAPPCLAPEGRARSAKVSDDF